MRASMYIFTKQPLKYAYIHMCISEQSLKYIYTIGLNLDVSNYIYKITNFPRIMQYDSTYAYSSKTTLKIHIHIYKYTYIYTHNIYIYAYAYIFQGLLKCIYKHTYIHNICFGKIYIDVLIYECLNHLNC